MSFQAFLTKTQKNSTNTNESKESKHHPFNGISSWWSKVQVSRMCPCSDVCKNHALAPLIEVCIFVGLKSSHVCIYIYNYIIIFCSSHCECAERHLSVPDYKTGGGCCPSTSVQKNIWHKPTARMWEQWFGDLQMTCGKWIKSQVIQLLCKKTYKARTGMLTQPVCIQ